MSYTYQVIPTPNVAYLLKDLYEQKKAHLDYLTQLAIESKKHKK